MSDDEYRKLVFDRLAAVEARLTGVERLLAEILKLVLSIAGKPLAG